MKRRLIAAAALTTAGVGLAAATRLRPLGAAPAPRHAADYAAALARVAQLQADDSPRVTPTCRTTLLSHGAATPWAVGMLHGFTNCPAQFQRFAALLHAQGHTVLLPRLRHHGLERTAPDFAGLRAEEMVALACETADILHGLGERTLLIGFSLGGAMAAWAAQHRADLDHVAIVAPALGLSAVPLARRRLYARLLTRARNRFVWWDESLRETVVGPPHAYPRYATRAVGEMLRLALAVDGAARRQIYAAAGVTVITNPCDDVVDNAGIERVMAEWRRQGAPVQSHAFPAEWRLIHDLFDPTQPLEQTARVYPQLLAWLAPE